MRLNSNYNIITQFDVSEIADEIVNVSSDFWDLNKSRQNKFGVHKFTKSIFINEVNNMWEGVGYPIEKYFVSEKLNLLTDNIIFYLENHFGGKVGKTLYINLPAGHDVGIHADHGYYLTSVHRCHIPIITNDAVDFTLGDEIINMKTGTCYEINNAGLHAVNNRGTQDRIHLLIDIIPMNAFK